MTPDPKRKPSAFRPPRPVTTATTQKQSHKAKVPTRRKSAPAKPLRPPPPSGSPSPSSSSDEPAAVADDDEDDSDFLTAAAAAAADDDPPPTLPPKLLTALLHHHFARDDTRIGKDASRLAGTYVEVFIKEAIARAGYERREAAREGGGEGGFLEVGLPIFFSFFVFLFPFLLLFLYLALVYFTFRKRKEFKKLESCAGP